MLEGALSPWPVVSASAYLAANARRFGDRLTGLTAVAGALPQLWGPLRDARRARRTAYGALRGMSEDRLVELGQAFAVDRLLPTLRPAARRLVEQARARGQRLLMVSQHLEVVAAPVAAHLGFDELWANRLEVEESVDPHVTGRLIPPEVGCELGGQPLRHRAHQAAIDLSRSAAYGSRGSDGWLLSSVGLPCAVHPDRALFRLARDFDWPVVR